MNNLFGNIFDFAGKGVKIFSVDEEAHAGLSSNEIHGASPEAKIIREESPEARNALGFIGALIDTTQRAGREQETYANDPGSTSKCCVFGDEEIERNDKG